MSVIEGAGKLGATVAKGLQRGAAVARDAGARIGEVTAETAKALPKPRVAPAAQSTDVMVRLAGARASRAAGAATAVRAPEAPKAPRLPTSERSGGARGRGGVRSILSDGISVRRQTAPSGAGREAGRPVNGSGRPGRERRPVYTPPAADAAPRTAGRAREAGPQVNGRRPAAPAGREAGKGSTNVGLPTERPALPPGKGATAEPGAKGEPEYDRGKGERTKVTGTADVPKDTGKKPTEETPRARYKGNPAAEDLYRRLGVKGNALPGDIKDAYRAAARKYHPDNFKKGSPEAERAAEEFKRVSEAYEHLSDKGKRSFYDEFGTADTSKKSDSADQTAATKGDIDAINRIRAANGLPPLKDTGYGPSGGPRTDRSRGGERGRTDRGGPSGGTDRGGERGRTDRGGSSGGTDRGGERGRRQGSPNDRGNSEHEREKQRTEQRREQKRERRRERIDRILDEYERYLNYQHRYHNADDRVQDNLELREKIQEEIRYLQDRSNKVRKRGRKLKIAKRRLKQAKQQLRWSRMQRSSISPIRGKLHTLGEVVYDTFAA